MEGKPTDLRLAVERRRCHEAAVNGSRGKFPRAGGALLAGAILLGVVGGTWAGEPSIGFLAGLGVGLALVAGLWLAERPRDG